MLVYFSILELCSKNDIVQPIRIVDHEADPNLRHLQQVGRTMNGRYPTVGWHHVGTSLSAGESGSPHVRVSPINSCLKSSYGYFWCVGVAGFGLYNGQEQSFLSHGQDDIDEQRTHLRDVIRRLLSMCGVETSDFIIFGGQNNLPDANYQDGTLHHSDEIRAMLSEVVIDETGGKIRPVTILPASFDNCKTDLIGKSVLLETPLRTLHIFERLIPGEGEKNEAVLTSPKARAVRC